MLLLYCLTQRKTGKDWQQEEMRDGQCRQTNFKPASLSGINTWDMLLSPHEPQLNLQLTPGVHVSLRLPVFTRFTLTSIKTLSECVKQEADINSPSCYFLWLQWAVNKLNRMLGKAVGGEREEIRKIVPEQEKGSKTEERVEWVGMKKRRKTRETGWQSNNQRMLLIHSLGCFCCPAK